MLEETNIAYIKQERWQWFHNITKKNMKKKINNKKIIDVN